MKKQIFISRVLNPESSLRRIEQIHEVSITAESLVEIHAIEVTRLPEADWFYFYSRNGVDSFARQWQEKWMSSINNENIRWAAMGPGTAETMTGWGIHCDFVGHGTTEEIAEQFLTRIKPTESVLFFRATHSRDRMKDIIAGHRQASSVVIYDNPLLSRKFTPMDIGIFTSSRNALAFFQSNPVPRHACIAIGQPTADTLISLEVPEQKIFVADEPSESAIRDVLLELLTG